MVHLVKVISGMLLLCREYEINCWAVEAIIINHLSLFMGFIFIFWMFLVIFSYTLWCMNVIGKDKYSRQHFPVCVTLFGHDCAQLGFIFHIKHPRGDWHARVATGQWKKPALCDLPHNRQFVTSTWSKSHGPIKLQILKAGFWLQSWFGSCSLLVRRSETNHQCMKNVYSIKMWKKKLIKRLLDTFSECYILKKLSRFKSIFQ